MGSDRPLTRNPADDSFFLKPQQIKITNLSPVSNLQKHRQSQQSSDQTTSAEMFASITRWHSPSLFVATVTNVGEFMSFFNPEYTIPEFGLRPDIAASPSAQSIVVWSSAPLGLAIFIPYA